MSIPKRANLFSSLFFFAICLPVETFPSDALPSNKTSANKNQVEELVVSATRWETAGTPTASSVSVIGPDEIQASGSRTVANLLRRGGGVQINDQYGDGSRTTVSMRGFGANAQANSLILVDGRRLNNTDLAAPSLNTISLKDVERIEIVQGSSAVLYGDHAVGGVINIITRQPQTFNLRLEAEAGSYATRSYTGRVENVFSNGFALRGSYQSVESDNYRDNNEKDYKNGLVELAYGWNNGRLFIEHQDIDEEIRLPGAIFFNQVATDRKQSRFPNDFNVVDSRATRAGGRYQLSDNWQVAAELTDRRSRVDGIVSNFNFVQHRRNRSFNPRIKAELPLSTEHLSITAGIDLEKVDYDITAFGITESEQSIHSAYFQVIAPIHEKTNVIAGFRKARRKENIASTFSFPTGETFDDKASIATLGLSYQPDDHRRFKLKYEEIYRFPLIDEETNIPSDIVTLDTQTGESYEASVDWWQKHYSAKLLLYHLSLTDEIDFDPAAGAFGANANLDPTERNGVIAEGALFPLETLTIRLRYAYTDAVFTNGPWSGNRIPFVAKHQGHFSIDYEATDELNLYFELQGVNERVISGDYANTFKALPGHLLGNFTARYRYGAVDVTLRVRNLFDKEYSDFATSSFNPATFFNETGFYPAPERHLFLSLGYTF